MTVGTTTSSVTYAGNGATTLFTFPFIGVASADLEVIYTDTSGTQTILVPSQYTLVINAVPVGGLWGIGGSVTYPTSGSPIQVGTFITINRILPYTQTISIANQGAFYPQAVEQGLDKLELQIQQIQTEGLFDLRTPVTDLVPPNVLPVASLRANGYLGFDSTGQPIILQVPAPIPGGGISFTPRRVTNSTTATVGLIAADSGAGISLYQSGSAVTTVQLPVGFGPYPIFDGTYNMGTFPVTVLPPVGLTILGQTSYQLVFDNQTATFWNDGFQILVN